MENYSSVLMLASAFMTTGLVMWLIVRRANRVFDMGIKLAGIWTNESKSLRVILHQIDSAFQAEIIWVENQLDSVRFLGFRLIKDMIPVRYGFQVTGIYTDPFTGFDYPMQLLWSGKGKLKLALLHKVNGRFQVLREEIWYLTTTQEAAI